MGASRQFPSYSKNNSFEKWIIFLKKYIPTLRDIAVSQQIEMTINSSVWLKKSWKLCDGLWDDKESKNT